MSHHYIKIKNLTFKYPDNSFELKNISFEIEHGDSLAIIGESGSGKSTLLKHLNGTILPQDGTIDIGGIELTKQTVKIIRSKVGIVFQNTDNQLFMPTVEENIIFGLKSSGLTTEKINSLLATISHQLNISSLLKKHPFKLSGGEKRKVCIASVLISSPEILLLDEPTSELDPKSSYEITTLLSTFKHTKVIATHNLNLVQNLCNKTLLLKNGEVLYFGSTEELFKNNQILKEGNMII